MKEYKTIITLVNGAAKEMTITEEQATENKNIQNYIFTVIPQETINFIDVALWNEYTKKYYNERTYSKQLEQIKGRNNRVKITYLFENGEISQTRCYIGKSTGWIPCYLEIKKSNSTGGGGLLTNNISNIEIVR